MHLHHAQTRARIFLSHIKQPPVWAQALNVVGEAGEFAEAFRRYTGNARRVGTFEELGGELADVIISAIVMAEMLGVDAEEIVTRKFDTIMSRGFGNQSNG